MLFTKLAAITTFVLGASCASFEMPSPIAPEGRVVYNSAPKPVATNGTMETVYKKTFAKMRRFKPKVRVIVVPEKPVKKCYIKVSTYATDKNGEAWTEEYPETKQSGEAKPARPERKRRQRKTKSDTPVCK